MYQLAEFVPEKSTTHVYTTLHGNATYMHPKVKSYRNGSYKELKVAVCKYPDGTIVLNDGKNCVVQKPEHDWERYCTKAQYADERFSFYKCFARPFVQAFARTVLRFKFTTVL